MSAGFLTKLKERAFIYRDAVRWTHSVETLHGVTSPEAQTALRQEETDYRELLLHVERYVQNAVLLADGIHKLADNARHTFGPMADAPVGQDVQTPVLELPPGVERD